jgi:hypothetical protein
MSLLDELEPTRGADCVSDLGFDRLASGELEGQRSAEIAAHLQGCARCAERAAALGLAQAAFQRDVLPGLLALSPVRRSKARQRWLGVLAAASSCAIAAAALLALRAPQASPPASDVRSKGAPSLGFFVQHRGHIRQGEAAEVVAPGDTLRFTYSTPERAYFAVLSRDGAGHGSVYFPAAPATRAELVEAGHTVPLPIGTELDAVTGRETLVGLFCTSALPLEPVRAALERDPSAPAPAGCIFDRLAIDKRAGSP